MNIFYLDKDPILAAEMSCDKHVCKMIIESAQMLSTAHRIIDGTEYYGKTANGRKIKRWKHPDKNLEASLYLASHVKHPSTIWVMQSAYNYIWLYRHMFSIFFTCFNIFKSIYWHYLTISIKPFLYHFGISAGYFQVANSRFFII